MNPRACVCGTGTSVALVLVVVLALAGCGSAGDAGTASQPVTTPATSSTGGSTATTPTSAQAPSRSSSTATTPTTATTPAGASAQVLPVGGSDPAVKTLRATLEAACASLPAPQHNARGSVVLAVSRLQRLALRLAGVRAPAQARGALRRLVRAQRLLASVYRTLPPHLSSAWRAQLAMAEGEVQQAALRAGAPACGPSPA